MKKVAMRFAWFTIWLTILCFVGIGCAGPAKMRNKVLANPTAKDGHFIKLDQCSPEMYEYFVRREYAVRIGLLNAFERISKDMNSERTTQYITRTRGLLEDGYKADLELIKRIKAGFEPATDELYYYTYDHGTKLEQGWLVARRGKIKEKFGVMESETNAIEESP